MSKDMQVRADLEARAYALLLEKNWTYPNRAAKFAPSAAFMVEMMIDFASALSPAAPNKPGDGEPPEVQYLRNVLTKRAASPDFNEWQAREIISYIDRLRPSGAPLVEGEARETQLSIGAWADEVFGPVTDLARAVERASEEMKELQDDAEAGAVPEVMVKEMADVVIVLMRLANVIGQDLQAAIDAKMAVNRKRQWRADGTGHGYHIKPDAALSTKGEAGQ